MLLGVLDVISLSPQAVVWHYIITGAPSVLLRILPLPCHHPTPPFIILVQPLFPLYIVETMARCHHYLHLIPPLQPMYSSMLIVKKIVLLEIGDDGKGPINDNNDLHDVFSFPQVYTWNDFCSSIANFSSTAA
jgi:hypothetical protein